jgi:hypothetical protein
MLINKYKYKDIRDKIETGDLLLCSGNSIISKAIQNITNCNISHVGLIEVVRDRVMILEAHGTGIRHIPLTKYFDDYENDKKYNGRLFIARKKKYSFLKNGELLDFAYSKLGKSYNYTDLLEILNNETFIHRLFGVSKYRKENKMICSEFVNECFLACGYSSMVNKNEYIYPSHFTKDKNIEIMYEVEF